MATCHAAHCEHPATTKVRLSNDYGTTPWTSGIDYCDEHAEVVGWGATDRGMRVLIEELV